MKGQALISLIFFAIIATTVTTAAVVMVYVNFQSGTKLQRGTVAYAAAQGGIENGLLRLLRDPSYVGESGMAVGDGTADISVSGTGTIADPYIIISKGRTGDYVRQVQVSAIYTDNHLSVLSRKEIY